MGVEEATVARAVPWDRLWEELCGYDRTLNFLTVVVASLGVMALGLGVLVPIQFMLTAMLLIAALVVATLFAGLSAQFRLARAIWRLLGEDQNWTLPDGIGGKFRKVENCRVLFDTEQGVRVFRPRDTKALVGALPPTAKAN